MKIVSAGTKRTPPPTPTRPPARPPATAIRTAIEHVAAHRTINSIATPTSSAAKSRETARWGMRCWIAVPITTPSDRRDREQQAGGDVDVAVEAALGDRAEQADQDDRAEAGAGRQPLPVAEPEDQQRHDHGAAADAEDAAEDARQGADRGELQGALRGHRAILSLVPPESGRGERGPGLGPLARLRDDPVHAAILTDVDGTLAPIVPRPEQAAVPAQGDASCSRG